MSSVHVCSVRCVFLLHAWFNSVVWCGVPPGASLRQRPLSVLNPHHEPQPLTLTG